MHYIPSFHSPMPSLDWISSQLQPGPIRKSNLILATKTKLKQKIDKRKHGQRHLLGVREKKQHGEHRLRDHLQELLVQAIHVIELSYVLRDPETPNELRRKAKY